MTHSSEEESAKSELQTNLHNKPLPRNFKEILEVVIDNSGTFRYGLIEVTNTKTKEKKFIVRGGAEYNNCKSFVMKYKDVELAPRFPGYKQDLQLFLDHKGKIYHVNNDQEQRLIVYGSCEQQSLDRVKSILASQIEFKYYKQIAVIHGNEEEIEKSGFVVEESQEKKDKNQLLVEYDKHL